MAFSVSAQKNSCIFSDIITIFVFAHQILITLIYYIWKTIKHNYRKTPIGN